MIKLFNLIRRPFALSIGRQSQSDVEHVEIESGKEYPAMITLKQRGLWSENQRKMYLFFNKQLKQAYKELNPAVKEAKK